jgi:hypothetical protein
MWPQWTNMLSLGQWALLLAVPPAIIALYFLKLRRRPLQVPSTLLWRRTVEDLHVNSLWQRLRQNLLLWLQLLLLAILILALLRPSWRGQQLSTDRAIFLIDNSASMSATDEEGSRLAAAKRQIAAFIDELPPGAVAMLISFADRAKVEQTFTDNRRDLHRALEQVAPTARPTSLDEALRVAAGLANPTHTATDTTETEVAVPPATKLYIVSDGKFPDVKALSLADLEPARTPAPDSTAKAQAGVSVFSLGNLEPVFVPIGLSGENLGITSFATRRNEERQGELQAFARIENFGQTDRTVEVELLMEDELLDAQRVSIAAGQSTGLVFDLGALDSGGLELRIDEPDTLVTDNRAWTSVRPADPVPVLVVTPGNEPLRMTLSTDRVSQLADVTFVTPDYLESPEYQNDAAEGRYRLIIFDRCQPASPPQASTLSIGTLPAVGGWQALPEVIGPQIIDSDQQHPLLRDLQLWDLRIREARPLDLSQVVGATVLVQSTAGPLFAIAPRGQFEDAVLAFELVREDGVVTDWPVKLSFPLFALNLIEYAAGSAHHALENVRPGQMIDLEPASHPAQLTVRTPINQQIQVSRDTQDAYPFSTTDVPGLYDVTEAADRNWYFAVNLFDPAESNIAPRPQDSIQIGYVEVAGQSEWQGTRREAWKVLAWLAMAVLLGEWYIYNRRVFV